MTKETNSEMEVQSQIQNPEPTENPEIENEEPQINLEELVNEEEAQEELEEAEFEGKKYKLPKELKGALLRQADYTRKTQEISEARKKYEAQQQDLQKATEATKQEFESYAEIYNLDQQLKQYDALDWNELAEKDPASAFKIDLERRALLNQRHKKTQEIAQKEQEFFRKQQEETAKLEGETKAVLSREIKNWGIELESKLSDYAKSNGIPEATMRQAVKGDAIAVKILHKAYLYDQLQQRALNKPKTPEAPAPIKPIKAVSSRVSNIPSDKDSPEEWLAKRNAQIRAKYK